LNRRFIAMTFATILLVALSAHAQERIPIKDIRLPSNDLVSKERGVLSPEEAWELKKAGLLNLAKLNPKESELWKDQVSQSEDEILGQAQRWQFQYAGALTSQSGLLRFNAKGLNTNDVGPYIIHLDKELHTLLMRKNLLRKLGYQIPKIEYQKQVVLKFKDIEQKNRFIKRRIPENTFGAPSRWVTEGENDDSLEVVLQDVAVTRPSQKDHYNLAMGVPPRALSSRTLRSLIVPYAILEIGESANKVPWNVGRIEDDHYLLPHFTLAQMNATTDDVLWILERLQKLSRKDFAEVVEQAHYPRPVEKLLIEKLVSRRNSILELFKDESSFQNIPYNSRPEEGELLVEGRLTQEDWPNYASRFAHGVPDSPFESLGHTLFAEVQGEVITGLVSKANEYLEAFDINEARFEFLKKDFQEGLDQFVETGEFREQGVETWVTPTLNGQLILSRDIVVGNYLGTDNLVQLADTFGYSIRLGAHLGIERLLNFSSASVNGGISLVKTFSHLKPVQSLKESLKEPYTNMIVPMLKRKLRKQARNMAQYLEENPDDAEEKRGEELEKIMQELNNTLGVGESLIVTQRIASNIGANARFVVFEGASASAGANLEGLVIKRLHLYRKDAKSLQVYVDNGKSTSLSFTFQFNNTIPLLRFQDKNAKGDYQLQVYDLDINLDKEENPDLLPTAQALSYLLEDDSTELLDEIQAPHKIKNDFKDRSQKMAVLHWRSRSLTQNDKFSVKSGDSPEAHLIKTTMGLQSGLNYRSFLTDVANYYLGKYFEGVTLKNELWRNPGQSFFGVSKTSEGRFEARLLKEQDKLEHMFLAITNRQEGWKISENKLKQALHEINQRYGRVLFPEKSARDATKLKVYTISTQLSIYEQGLLNLMYNSRKEIKSMQRSYRSRAAFSRRCNPSRNRILVRNDIDCGNFGPLLDRQTRCQSYHQKKKYHKMSRCLIKLTQSLEKALEFDDFISVIGEENIFLSGQVNGFREDSEILISPIPSNTIGTRSSRFINGPVEAIRQMLGLQNGEFNGSWIREFL